ncbi:MAG: S41 family peptidase [Pelagibacteraceae bacterium TMED124]|nr:peptidase S41 [Rickettsiales bacterium]RPG19205.1 MAG: S41 family peptidase [Pelagibacteraceae bacterium TMED124]|tara:strand:+ start:51 stop:1310 length:1260 start_codon:yes stop_codon:yes gene_type:complete
MIKFLTYFFLVFLYFSDATSEDDKEVYKHLNLFGEAFEKIKNNYVEEVSSKELVEAAIEGMLSSLDPHSTFLNTDELKELKVQTKGEFGGLGIEVTLENGFVKVISPIDDTPASRAGILAGDLITHLDDEPVLGMTLSEAVSLMRGRAGSKIKLTVNREDNKTLQIVITRAVIELKAVKAKIQNNIGYIRVSSFNQKVDTQIIKAISKFKKNNKIIGYVLDLRNNPGGLLDQAVNVTDIFLDRGEIVSTRGRFERDGSRFNAIKTDLTDGLPLVVLINQGSASASEIVAGALQDHKRAIIMGTKSFGKGSVQTILPSGENVALKLTTAKYYTPFGRSIQKTGIDPDILVEQVELKKLSEPETPSRKEADLRGAIDNDQSSAINANENESSKKKEDDSSNDYQLSRAFDLILALDLANNN